MNPSILPLALSAASALWVAVIANRRRGVPGSRSAVWLMLALACWSIFAAIGRSSPNLDDKLFWARWESIGIETAPLLWALFALQFSGHAESLTARRLAAIWTLPAALLLLAWTNPLHGLVWRDATLVNVGGFATLRLAYGPVGWLIAAYGWACLLVGSVAIAAAYGSSPGLYRRQTFVLLACAAAPWLANALYLLGIGPPVDFTAIGFTVSGFGAVWALTRFHLLDLVPVAWAVIVESLPDGVAVLDTANRVVNANPAFGAIVRADPGALIGRGIAELLPALPRLGPQAADGSDVLVLDRDARQRSFDVRTSTLVDHHGRRLGRVIALRDVTDSKTMEAELRAARDAAEKASRAKSDFLAVVSHEVRTPMNAVVGMTGLLLDGPLPPDQRESLEVIRKSGDSLLAILNDILDFSKIEAGHLEIERIPFSLHTLAHEAIDLVAQPAAARGLALHCELPAGVPDHVVGDATRVRQILLNLLGNAVKFTPSGSVELSATVDGPAANGSRPVAGSGGNGDALRVHFAVRDSGIGIPPERMDRLFKSFSQVDSSTSRQYGGTGLGLAISKRLAELMGGTMWAESELGKGSTFHAVLPMRPCAEVARPARARRTGTDPALADRWPLRILVAEDNRVNQTVALRMLERLGYRADVAGNGAEAIEAIDRQAYDVVLMDVQMPEVDGLEATRRIRERPPADPPYVIAMTANVADDDRRACTEAGMDDYVGKPVDLSGLRAALERAAESRGSRAMPAAAVN